MCRFSLIKIVNYSVLFVPLVTHGLVEIGDKERINQLIIPGTGQLGDRQFPRAIPVSGRRSEMKYLNTSML